MKLSIIAIFVSFPCGMGYSQAYREAGSFELSVPFNAPDGVTFQLEVPNRGTTNRFNWSYSGSGWRDLRFTFTAPDGTELLQQAGGPRVSTAPFWGIQTSGLWSFNLTEHVAGTPSMVSWGYEFVYVREARQDFPLTGPSVPELAGIDAVITDFLVRNGTEAATIAIVRNRRLVYKRGYGWGDRERTRPIDPDVAMRIASNTKPLVSRAIEILINQGLIDRSDSAFEILEVPPPEGMAVTDPRVRDITVANLLTHQSGFPGGPGGIVEVGEKLGLGRPANLWDLISYMWTITLDFDPGSARRYLNWNYQLLGAIIERVSGRTFEEFLVAEVGDPVGMKALRVSPRHEHEVRADEIWYAGGRFVIPNWDPGGDRVENVYAIDMTTAPGAGSLACSAADYCRHLRAFFHTGVRKRDNLSGVNWVFSFFGSSQGTMSITRDRITPDGENVSYCFIANEAVHAPQTHGQLRNALNAVLDGITEWPDIDLFIDPPASVGRHAWSSYK